MLDRNWKRLAIWIFAIAEAIAFIPLILSKLH